MKRKYICNTISPEKSQKYGLDLLQILLKLNVKKRIIFTLLYKNRKFVMSRNFITNEIGDADWIVKNCLLKCPIY